MHHLTFNAVTAHRFDGDVSITRPAINRGELRQILHGWVSRQGKHWPSRSLLTFSLTTSSYTISRTGLSRKGFCPMVRL